MKSILISILFLFSAIGHAADLTKSLQALPVQDGGRFKPFDTFARESLELVYGKDTFKLEGQKKARPAVEIVMTWMLQPSAWQDTPMFEIRFGELKKGLKLNNDQRYFTYNQIIANDRLSTLFQELGAKRESKEKLDPYFQALQRLEGQLFTFKEIASGKMIRVAPAKEGTTWVSVADLQDDLAAKFVEVSKAFIGVLSAVTVEPTEQKAKEAQAALDKAVLEFEALARAQNPDFYPSENIIKAEIHFNDFHPFKWAWISYLLGAIACFLAWILGKQVYYKPAWALGFLGLLIHLYGFALRSYISGRAPVSNMYETVVWVGFGAVVFAMFIEAAYRWKFILLAGYLVGGFCLVLADMAPVILDPSLQPLEPVLRNNFWLLVHVLTITISYAAFFLAFALGDIGLIYYLKGEKENAAKIKAITLALYRSMQIGVAFLAPGIILGGIWADYSWGRFWGWDPKETWALIALLGYLAVMHGRLSGWLRDFGMICSGVLTFSLVIMAWYGVNYVLGAGLHSYGFGAGGVEYVSVFVGLHLLFVVFTAVVRFGRLKKA